MCFVAGGPGFQRKRGAKWGSPADLHGLVVELEPIVALIPDVKHEGFAQKQVLVPEACGNSAEVEEVRVLACGESGAKVRTVVAAEDEISGGAWAETAAPTVILELHHLSRLFPESVLGNRTARGGARKEVATQDTLRNGRGTLLCDSEGIGGRTAKDFHAWFFVYAASAISGCSRDSKTNGSRSEDVRDPRKKATLFFVSQGFSAALRPKGIVRDPLGQGHNCKTPP